jgi:hypothetical protein
LYIYLSAWKIRLEELQKHIKQLEKEKKCLEVICVNKDEEMSLVKNEHDKILGNLHAFVDNLEVTKEGMKQDILKLNNELGESKLEHSNTGKLLKNSQKENHNLSKILDNLQDNVKNLKAEKNVLKNVKAKAESDFRKLEKKVFKKVKNQTSETQTDVDVSQAFKEEHSSETLSRSYCLSSTPSLEASTNLGMLNSKPLEVNLNVQPLENSFLEFDCQDISEAPKPEAETKFSGENCAKSFDNALDRDTIAEKNEDNIVDVVSSNRFETLADNNENQAQHHPQLRLECESSDQKSTMSGASGFTFTPQTSSSSAVTTSSSNTSIQERIQGDHCLQKCVDERDMEHHIFLWHTDTETQILMSKQIFKLGT